MTKVVGDLGVAATSRGDAVRSEVAGTGLGLRIVQTIVHNHHGTLSLVSEVDKGTTATMVIPIANPEADADSHPRGAAAEQSPGPDG